MKKIFLFGCCCLIFLLISPCLVPETREISFAEGFEIEQREGWTLLRVTRPWRNASQELTYGLYPRGTRPPDADCTFLVEVPVRRIVVLSTSYLSSLSVLCKTGTLVGIDNRRYVYSADVIDMVGKGEVAEIGEHPYLDIERLLFLDPDIIMTPVYGGGGAYEELLRAGFPVAVNGDWLETSALGRAEWLVFIAAFFGATGKAFEHMDKVAGQYGKLSRLAGSIEEKPTVFLNTPWQGTWYMPAGESYLSLLLEDAGADYLWRDTAGTGSLALDFESVYGTAGEADFWIHTGNWRSIADAREDDPRFTGFKAFSSGAMFNNDARLRPSGSNDFWETGAVAPQLVLEDLIRIFHPGLLKAGELHFYRKLD